MVKKFLLSIIAFMPMTLSSLAQTFQGVTEGDKAVTYVAWSSQYAGISKVDNSLIGDDGVLEIPKTVTYNGTEYSTTLVYNNRKANFNGASAVKKIIIHGKISNHASGYNSLRLSEYLPNLEFIEMENRNEDYATCGGVLYGGPEESPYQTILWVPIKWKPEGNTPFLEGTTRIDQYAFERVEYVGDEEVFTIPDQIESLGNYAFQYSPIRGVRISENANLTATGSYCFQQCKKLTQVIIPDNIKTISGQTFYGCSALPTIDLNQVEVVRMSAFYDCTSLETVKMSDHLQTIQPSAFYNCRKLRSIDLGQTAITSIPSYCFHSCTSLREVQLPEGVTSLGFRSFYLVTLSKVLELPESLVTIDEWGLPDYIGSSPFEGEKRVTIGKNVKNMTGLSICQMAFDIDIDPENPYFLKDNADNIIYNHDKTELVFYLRNNTRKDFIVPAGVKTIEDGAFYQLNGPLQHVILPSSCEKIGNFSFNNIQAVTIPPSVKTFGTPVIGKKWDTINYSNTGGHGMTYYAFHGCTAYIMGAHPEEITIINSILYRSTNNYVYVTKTGYDNIMALNPKSETESAWYEPINGGYLLTDIPVTLSSTGLSTMCRDFDVDLSASQGLEAYVATSFEKGGAEDVVKMEKVSTGSYVPSRTGADNYDFYGVVLKGEPGQTYTYAIGEQDYLTDSQTVLSDEQTDGNMLVGTPIHIYIDKTDGDMTNFVLKGGKFRFVSAYGELAWNKAYLQIPTADCLNGETGGAKNISFVFGDEESGTTAITTPAGHDATDAPYYNLNGVRVTNLQKGVYIRNNKKVVIK